MHWQRELRSNWKTLWVLLTGRDVHGERVAGMSESPWWKQIIQLTATQKRPDGIKGSPKLLSRNKCRCLAAACISQCSCPHCTTFLENLDHRNLATQCGWRMQPGAECDECGGGCRDPDGAWQSMSRGLVSFTNALLCPAVPVPGVVLNTVDPLTGLEVEGDVAEIKMIPRACWYGQCSKCGWNNRFAKFPDLKLKIKEDDQTEREVSVRACPVEARLDMSTTYHEFLKMERGKNVDGSPYTQPEWTPVTASRRQFYYRLHGFMETFLPHYFKVLWHEAFDKVFTQLYKRQAFVGIPSQPQPPESMIGTLYVWVY